MQLLKSGPSPYSKVFLVKGKGGNPASRRELAKAEFEVVVFVCVLFFSRLVFCVWLSFVLFSLSSSSLLWLLSVWLFAFVAPPTIASAHVGIFFPPRSLSFASSISLLAFLFSLCLRASLIIALWPVFLSTSCLFVFRFFHFRIFLILDFCIFLAF